jgi:hypothetical protein
LSIDSADEYENKISAINKQISRIVFGQDKATVEDDLPRRHSVDGRR